MNREELTKFVQATLCEQPESIMVKYSESDQKVMTAMVDALWPVFAEVWNAGFHARTLMAYGLAGPTRNPYSQVSA